ncbi:MAG: hypothetical protein VX589_09585 [Myxococcota bacterium]|nr:hypothetical protein [Myxococcota bacterium]
MSMTIFLTLVAAFATPKLDTSLALQVVGVYRPVDLAGRVVQAPREVYLQSMDDGHDLKGLVGVQLEVFRRMPVPASMSMRDALRESDDRLSIDGSGQDARADAARDGMGGKIGKAASISLAPAKALAPVDAGRPAGFAPQTNAVAHRSAVSLGSTKPGGDLIVRPRPATVNVEKIKRFVGRIEIVAVQGDVAVARVVSDGLSAAKSNQRKAQTADELPTILTGDVARRRPPIAADDNKRKAKKVSARSKKRLGQERRKIEDTLRKRNTKKRPFVRKSMKWDL